MKRAVFLSISLISLFLITGCPDEEGLHNQKASGVVFEFKNFPVPDGEYAIPGDYNDWDNSKAQVTISGGNGVSSSQSITSDNVKFTLVRVDEWERTWYPAIEGNADDSGALRNFWVGGIPADTALKIVLDGASSPVTPELRSLSGEALTPAAPVVPADSLTVTASTADSISLSWSAASGAGVTYEVHRSDTETGDYTKIADSITATTYTDTGLAEDTAYWYKVRGINPAASESEGAFTAPKRGKTASSGVTYPVIDMTGPDKDILDDDFKPNAASSVDSWDLGTQNTINYDIKGLYVTNDATNLYIALDFGDAAPAGWENDRITVFINCASATDSVEYDNAEDVWGKNAAMTVTVSGGEVNAYICQIMKESVTGGATAASWTQGDDWAYSGPKTVKFSAPLSSIGSPAAGTEIKVFAAFSTYGWWDDAAHVQVKDLIPAGAGNTSNTSDDNDTLAVDFSKALSWTLR